MLRSVAEMGGLIVDSRKLRFAGTFFSLPAETADNLIRDLYAYICEQFGDICVLDWEMRDRVVKDIEESLKKRKRKSGAYMMGLQGGIRCERIRNKTSFRQYLFDATYPSTPRTDNLPMLESVDYAPYYNLRVRPYMKNHFALKASVLRLFDLDRRMHLQKSGPLDVFAFIHVAPMMDRKDPDKPPREDLFSGSFYLDLASCSLGDELDLWAERLCDFGRIIAEKYPRTNIRVEINPQNDRCYSAYYGLYPSQDDPILKKTRLRAFSQEIYVTEVGWAHYISKETRTLGKLNLAGEDRELLQIEELPNGALLVRAKRPISQMKMADLKAVKRCIYELILPREHCMGIKYRLRSEWEYVPVFENELSITDEGYLFKHHGTIDAARLCDLAMIDPKKLEWWK